MNQIKLPNNKSVIVETSELIELARLSYFVERYQFMFQQRQKRKLINSYDEYLEKILQANLDYNIYLGKLKQKYPTLRKAEKFYFNVSDNKIFIIKEFKE